MIARRFAARSVLASCALGLTAVSVVGGSLMAAAEGVAHSKGSLALFNVITTVVFGRWADEQLGQSGSCRCLGRGHLLVRHRVGHLEIGFSRFALDALEREAATASRSPPRLKPGSGELMRGHVKRVLVAIGACIFLAGSACSDVAFIDEVTIVNDTEYSANVDVSDGTRDAWLGLTTVQPQSTTTIEDVIDQGEMWVVRFDYVGKYQEEVEISRRDLEQDDWTIEVPSSFEQRLRDLDVPPPPP